MGRGSGCSELGMAGAAGRCPDCSEADRARGRGRGVPPCVPHLGIAVDEGDVLPGALRLVRELRPGWEPARVKTKLFTDGITNKLVACYTDEDMVDAVLVRIYGRKTELFVDRETELRNFQVLRAHGCAPDLYCAFQNGLCYEFLPGIALGPDHVRDPRIFRNLFETPPAPSRALTHVSVAPSRLVAQEMARVHAIHANGSLPKPILWQKLHKYLTLVKTDLSPKVPNPSLHQDVPSLETLEHELAWMKETLSQLGSPVVLCHNDLLCKNIIYNRTRGWCAAAWRAQPGKWGGGSAPCPLTPLGTRWLRPQPLAAPRFAFTEQVRFIDYEYTGYNYQAFDIGNHFNEFAGVKEVDYRLYPSKDTQLQWLHSYLQAYKQLTQGEQGGAGPAVSDKELEALYVQVNKFSLASHFLWACWGLIQDKYSTIDFNFLRYAKLRFKQYFKMKPVVTALQLSK
ncbi:Ethanolamine kinase 2 [Aix galericulata]|nr:Ethanolamine kinase 2 [Aix galericulata]